MFVTFSCFKCPKNIMCLCLLLIIIDREKGMPFITSFPEFVISFPSVHPSLYLRSSFVHPSLFLRSSYSRRNGFTADLQRNYNGLAYERENALAIFQ